MWNLKYDTKEPMQQKQNHGLRQHTGGCQPGGAGDGGGMKWEVGISRCKLLYVEQINKVYHIAQRTIFNIL